MNFMFDDNYGYAIPVKKKENKMKEFSRRELEFLEGLLRDYVLGNPRLWRSWGDNEEAREIYHHVQKNREIATNAKGFGKIKEE